MIFAFILRIPEATLTREQVWRTHLHANGSLYGAGNTQTNQNTHSYEPATSCDWEPIDVKGSDA